MVHLLRSSATPDMLAGEPYDPFKTRVWQSYSNQDFRVHIAEIGILIAEMTAANSEMRTSALDEC
ncbi:hypothetical protein BDN72DRAFT_844279 [Pluteus cervinus]|uniref:Uncharacterized protein n=1 Tax=Pluteus cervinus TaxID=181527 RepID=A0ACD3ALW7_9AGAR|nr:hypothetical protein BDN72DRAFT_844279 [Pluteus cervinus]